MSFLSLNITFPYLCESEELSTVIETVVEGFKIILPVISFQCATLVADDMNKRSSEFVRLLPVLFIITCFKPSTDVRNEAEQVYLSNLLIFHC